MASGHNHDGLHAEVVALKKLWPDHRPGTVVWSIRVTPGGRLAMARPCRTCMKFLLESGVKSVVYSDTDGSLKKMKLKSGIDKCGIAR